MSMPWLPFTLRSGPSLVDALAFDIEEAVGPQQMFRRLELDALAHAYLFNGPVGVGKKRFARLLAQSILCEAPKHGILGYDGTCSSCRLFTAGTHPDLLMHEGEIKIGDREAGRMGDELTARDLVRALSLHAYGSGRRVLILGDIEFATHHAANALLKFFEEPPLGVVLILTSSSPGKLLGTIRSRLVEVTFPPLSSGAITRILQRDGVADADAARVAPAAQGSVTRARALLEDQGLREQVAAWFFEAVAGRVGESAWATRSTLSECLELIGLLLRDWAARVVGSPTALLSGESLRLRSLPQEREAVLAALNAWQDAQRMARTNVSAGLIVEGLRLALAQACFTPAGSR